MSHYYDSFDFLWTMISKTKCHKSSVLWTLLQWYRVNCQPKTPRLSQGIFHQLGSNSGLRNRSHDTSDSNEGVVLRDLWVVSKLSCHPGVLRATSHIEKKWNDTARCVGKGLNSDGTCQFSGTKSISWASDGQIFQSLLSDQEEKRKWSEKWW